MSTTRVTVLSTITAAALFLAWVPGADAYSNYSSCVSCHGGFRTGTYVSLADGVSWGDNLHDVHRNQISGGDCAVCHDANDPGSLAQACGSCHDAAGTRQHHRNAGASTCSGCHASPENPPAENVAPPGYSTFGIESCNGDGSEDFAGGPGGLDNDGDLLYDGSDSDCRSAPELTFDVNTYQPVGTAVAVTGDALAAGTWEYRFLLNGPATAFAWRGVRAFDTDPTWRWTTSEADVGYNRVKVFARPAGSADTAEWNATARSFVVSPALTVATAPPAPGQVGQPVTFQGQALPAERDWEYRFTMRGPGTGYAWTLMQDYSPSNSLLWTAPMGQEGLYKVQVRVRQVGSPLAFEERETIRYLVLP